MTLAMTRPPFNPNLVVAASGDQPRIPRGPLTVSQLTALVKQAIESSLPATVHVVGEISNFKRHGSGHLYLTLKDRSSELSCVMWRSAAEKLKFSPTDGLEVIATGAIDVYQRAGRYQLYIRKLEPRGVGALELAFRQLCEKLGEEGLFEQRCKKPLPRYARRIALITSPTGAVLADMLQTLTRRFPCLDVLVYPVRVQGREAAAEIAAAIRSVNANRTALGGIDLMIVGRGGGSLEDLWAFNEEPVARAIFASRIPIISAVGHEVDVTIADLVADVRAATPTAAAELAVPVLDDVLADLRVTQTRLERALRAKLDVLAARLDAPRQRGCFREPLLPLRRREQYLDELIHRAHLAISGFLRRLRSRLDKLEPIVQRISPHAELTRRAVLLRDAGHRLHWAISTRLLGENRMDELERLLTSAMRHRLAICQERCRRREQRLTAMNHRSVLGRGFSITRLARTRRIIRSCSQVADGTRVRTEVLGGEFESDVVNLEQLELFG